MSDAPAIHYALLVGQRAWAEACEIDVDDAGRVLRWHDNLLAPPSSGTLVDLETAGAGAAGQAGKPGRLHELGSGLVLAANVLDPWRDRPDALARQAPVLGGSAGSLRFATHLELGSSQTALHRSVDVLLESRSGPATAVIPLFCEPFGDVDPRPHDALVRDAALWNGLHGCALLARDLQANPRRFRRLAAGRVLETALGMSRRFGHHGFRIVVLWYDAGGRATRRLRHEIDRLRMRIGGEVELLATSWQSLFRRLCGPGSASPADGRYTRSLQARYFGRGAAARRPASSEDGA
ncbi:MAG TPA: hypothetical protein ENO23_07755 [Alphaproteobacteria bacterium]|nr:hypothetical protein [Alphaproteobacteria bacterium]